jgi:glycosyltransferase involved in cell wall biosynthesis
MPRVLIIHPFGGAGGSENVLLKLAARLREEFEPIAVVMEEGGLSQRLRDLGVEVVVHHLPGKRSVPLVPFAARSLAGQLRGRGISVIHANGTKAAILAAPMARRLGVPLLWMKHGHDYNRVAPRLLGPRCDHIACVSAAVAESFPARLRDRVSVVHPGVDVPSEAVPVGADPLIVTAGTLIPTKGHDTLIRAAGELRDRGIQARLEIAGTDHPRAPGHRVELRGLIRELRLEDRIELLGWIPDVGEAYDRARVVALGSRPASRGIPAEGAPLVLLEAMAHARPVVAPGGGGIGEVVGPAGNLVAHAKPDLLADALAPYLADRDLAAETGERGRERVLGAFTLDHMVRALSDRYRALIDGRASQLARQAA